MVTLLIYIPEVPGLMLGRDTNYPDCDFSSLHLIPPSDYWDNLREATTSSFHILPSS
jgi:hypothetical protein